MYGEKRKVTYKTLVAQWYAQRQLEIGIDDN
jgi:hypothetical protein